MCWRLGVNLDQPGAAKNCAQYVEEILKHAGHPYFSTIFAMAKEEQAFRPGVSPGLSKTWIRNLETRSKDQEQHLAVQ